MNLQSKQENKARQNFRKTSYPLIPTRTYAYQGKRNVRFLGYLVVCFFLLPPSWDSSFCLIADEFYFEWNSTKALSKYFPAGVEFGFLRIVAIIYLLPQWTKTGVFMDLPQILLLMLSRFKRVNYLIFLLKWSGSLRFPDLFQEEYKLINPLTFP